MRATPFTYAKKRVKTCTMDYPIELAMQKFAQDNMGSLVVVDADENIVGLLTDQVIFKALAEGKTLQGLTVGQLVLEPVVKVAHAADIEYVAEKFRENPSGRIVMVDGSDRIVGILKRQNIERFGHYDSAKRMLGR